MSDGRDLGHETTNPCHKIYLFGSCMQCISLRTKQCILGASHQHVLFEGTVHPALWTGPLLGSVVAEPKADEMP